VIQKKPNKNSQEVAVTSIRVNKETWKRFRIEAIERDMGQQEALEEALRAWLGIQAEVEQSEPEKGTVNQRRRAAG
jgi:hypothetical protein